MNQGLPGGSRRCPEQEVGGGFQVAHVREAGSPAGGRACEVLEERLLPESGFPSRSWRVFSYSEPARLE